MLRTSCIDRLRDHAPHYFRMISIPYPVVRIEGDEVDPLIVVVVLQDLMPADELVDPLAGGLDDSEQPHRLVIGNLPVHHRLPGQAQTEIAPGARHDAQAPYDIVIDLASASIHFVIRGGK